MRTLKTVVVSVALAAGGVVWACGGDDSSGDSGTDASSDDASFTDSAADSEIVTDAGKDSSLPRDSGVDGANTDASDEDGSDAAPCITLLKVLNAPVGTPWCNISIDGGTASTSGTQTICVPSGTTLTLAATPQLGFTIAPITWHHTLGDVDGGGDPGSGTTGTSGESTTSVVVTAPTCVWACCPGSAGVPACPTADQCP